MFANLPKEERMISEESSSAACIIDQDDNKIVEKKHNGESYKWQYVAAILASLSTFATGTIIGWTSQISKELMDGKLGFPITEDNLGWIASFNLLSAGLMALISGSLCDVVGRKRLLLILAIPLTIGWLLIYWATNIEMVYIGRFLTGMVGGANCALFAVYSNEIASNKIRGTLGSLNNLTLSFGMLFDAILGKYLSLSVYILSCSVIPVIFMMGFAFMPESPVYLVKEKNFRKAKEALQFLRGSNYDNDLIDQEINIIKGNMKNKITLLRSWQNLFSYVKGTTAGRNGLIVVVILMCFRVLIGIDAVVNYSSHIFESADMDFDPQIGTIALTVIQVVSGLFQSSLIDRVGRRILLISSAILIACCLLTVATCINLKNRNMLDEASYIYTDYLLLAALGIFFVGYALGFGPIPFLMIAEVFPVETKSTAAALGIFTMKMCSFLISKTFIMIKNSAGQDAAFFMYAGLAVIGSTLIYFRVPETKNKSSEEIMTILSQKK